MSNIKIPKAVRPGFWLIAKLGKPEIEKLIDIIKNTQITYKTDVLYEAFSNLFNPRNGAEILRTILSFTELTKDETDNQSLAKNLTASFIHEEAVENKEELNNLEDNLKVIFENFDQIKSIALLRNEYSNIQNPFLEAETHTDIRFINDILKQNDFFVITHKINLQYQSDEVDSPKTFSFSLNFEDLEKLKESIELAISREKIIREKYHGILNII